jgi:hypothetical protein
VVPVIDKLYLNRQYTIVKEIRASPKYQLYGGITISVDGTYASRNNNSDYGVVTIVEHCTPNEYLLHIAMKSASASCTSYQLESKLILEGIEYIVGECKLRVFAVGHDGKDIKQNDLDRVCDCDVLQGDPWHGQKIITADYTTTITQSTKCAKGDK